ncbi:DUF3307 domain-containing protein [Paraburkholderia sp. BCC1886]|uniref:DUF3307 domain-containing protein n=1 Tax=Paraburkholderia sp. BCC1886 TaxID=2562670 RepID=UPI0016427818|nr:DUF3307 domain-containing protein [Paraburkholderia sp. BCC1886]
MLFNFHLGFWAMLFWLVWGHFVADYPWQGDFVAIAKNHNTPVGKMFWKWVLPGHAWIHAGFVAFFTGHVGLGVVEGILHALTDRLKCNEKLSINADQTIHIVCKVIWAFWAVFILD